MAGHCSGSGRDAFRWGNDLFRGAGRGAAEERGVHRSSHGSSAGPTPAEPSPCAALLADWLSRFLGRGIRGRD